MRTRLTIASLYAQLYGTHAKRAATETAHKVAENKSELTRLVVTTAVVGVAARTAGFKAGYAYATSNVPVPTA